MMVRILIMDSHRVIRIGLTKALELFEDLEVVGAAEDGQMALTLCAIHQPDVVITELMLPVINGISLTQHISQNYPNTNVIAFDFLIEIKPIEAVLRAGAAAYLSKEISMVELVETIRKLVTEKGNPKMFARASG